jgi:hypothetical protein
MSSMACEAARSATRCDDSLSYGGSSPARTASSPTARYIAPVSRYGMPSRAAKVRATVDLPAPAGPSIAMTRAGGRVGAPSGVLAPAMPGERIVLDPVAIGER